MTGVGHDEDLGAALPGGVVETYLCDAGASTLTVDTTGRPLDLGREQRLFSRTQRIAIAIRDGGCMWPSCTAPPSWCEYHHIDHWAEHHGKTNVDDGVPLCRNCHMRLHNQNWRITRTRDPETGADTYWLHAPPGAATSAGAGAGARDTRHAGGAPTRASHADPAPTRARVTLTPSRPRRARRHDSERSRRVGSRPPDGGSEPRPDRRSVRRGMRCGVRRDGGDSRPSSPPADRQPCNGAQHRYEDREERPDQCLGRGQGASRIGISTREPR